VGDRELDERVRFYLVRGMPAAASGVGCQVLGVQQVEVEILLDERRPHFRSPAILAPWVFACRHT
jgi:hypothetical protein